jgi:hypothetical protein
LIEESKFFIHTQISKELIKSKQQEKNFNFWQNSIWIKKFVLNTVNFLLNRKVPIELRNGIEKKENNKEQLQTVVKFPVLESHLVHKRKLNGQQQSNREEANHYSSILGMTKFIVMSGNLTPGKRNQEEKGKDQKEAFVDSFGLLPLVRNDPLNGRAVVKYNAL